MATPFLQLAASPGYELHLHFDRIMMKKVTGIALNGPLRWRAFHLCTGSGKSVLGIISPVLKKFMGRESRLRFVLHAGSDTELLDQFSDYGILKVHMSSCFGGSYDRDNFLQWVRERLEQETERE
jgi:hypothetical protein